MPPKDVKKGNKTPATEKSTSIYGESEEALISPRSVSLYLTLEGNSPGPGEWIFLTVFNGQVIIDTRWQNGYDIQSDSLPLDLKQAYYQMLIADQPLIFLLRTTGGKAAKDPDPLLNIDNRAGAAVDLFPLVLGEEEIYVKVLLNSISTGYPTECSVEVHATANGESDKSVVPLMMTMISAHCLPFAKEGTVYLSAIGLNELHDPVPLNFGMSLSNSDANKIVWASASNGGLVANSAYNVVQDDIFIPEDIKLTATDTCTSVYWHAMKRVLVDPLKLRDRMNSPFLIEIAGVPRFGKIDVRGRYMGFVDAKVLLEPGQFHVTTCARLLFYNEYNLPGGMGTLLELPPASAKISVRDTDLLTDEYGHGAYVIIRFDLFEPLVAKSKISTLYELIGFPPPEGNPNPADELRAEPVPDDPFVDVRRIRKEGGALSVHKELSGLACRGTVHMNQGIKKTAANRLLLRIRYMLKQFPPGDCSNIEWQDTVTAQHAASRKAVTSSFAPQPPPQRAPSRIASARSRLAGDTRIAEEHTKNALKALTQHPRPLLSKVIRSLEERNDTKARLNLLTALSVQTRNRYLLWLFGGTEFDKHGSQEMAAASFRIAVKGDTSDGTTGSIGWAALHAAYHFNNNPYAAFVAVRKMRKSCELPTEWKKFLQRWIETSGEEEIFWMPGALESKNPMLLAAAFFLCLRCYKFSERLLQCIEDGCMAKGSRFNVKVKMTVDMYYVRVASFLLRRQLDSALDLTKQGIRKFGPTALMSQMRAVCLMCIRGWDGECESAFNEAARAGAEPCPSLLLQAALGGIKYDPMVALQRAAHAHKLAPSAHSALVIGRVYAAIGKEELAERWAAAAVKTEPLLADGWAYLAIIAMYERNINKARTMLRTAKQAGPITSDIEEELRKIMKVVRIEKLPDFLVKDLCFCEYY